MSWCQDGGQYCSVGGVGREGAPRPQAGVKPAVWGQLEAFITLVAFGISFTQLWFLFGCTSLRQRERIWDNKHLRCSANKTPQIPNKGRGKVL